MRLLRTLSTPRLFVLVTVVAAVAVGGTAIAVASRGSGPKPPPSSLARAIHRGLTAPAPQGITARIAFTNKLFPSGALTGEHASALMSGATGRLWVTDDGRGRLELQSSSGDVQILWGAGKVTIYDASSNTVYRATLPSHTGGTDTGKAHKHGAPSLAEIARFLTKAREHASVSGARPSDVAGRAAYTVTISPKHDGGLLGSAQLAWDAYRGVPLRIAVYAQGSSEPVLELKATDISYGPVSPGDVAISPPAHAKNLTLSRPARKERRPDRQGAKQPEGVRAVRAQASFPVVAPATLVGLPRQTLRLTSDSKTAIVVYGHGLGAIVVVERKADAGGGHHGGLLSNLPTVSLDGLTGHELATQLGTAIEWQRNAVAFVLAGSLPPSAAETAARALK